MWRGSLTEGFEVLDSSGHKLVCGLGLWICLVEVILLGSKYDLFDYSFECLLRVESVVVVDEESSKEGGDGGGTSRLGRLAPICRERM